MKSLLHSLFLLLLLSAVAPAFAAPPSTLPAPVVSASVEQWGIFEASLKATVLGNPFDVDFSAKFYRGTKTITASGFYDGDNTFRVRFMPPDQGEWNYETFSNVLDLNGFTGKFIVGKPGPANHGPVKVANTYHFAYADGTPYFAFGTTSYAWTSQGDALEEQTLATLKTPGYKDTIPFNKIRMCVFPKHYQHNTNEPVFYPFEVLGEGKPPENKNWDFTKFNPAFFQHLEKRIGQLRDMNIESDLILFHPYDMGTWGFDNMGAQADDRYLRYLIARLGAYRNVWWSLANEYDFIRGKRPSDWDRIFSVIHTSDPYAHLTSIHNGAIMYNATRDTVTHVSVQNGEAVEDFGRASNFRMMYGKPVSMDEVKYEGNIDDRWGQLSGEEMTYRFWIGMVSGVYVTHGETFNDPNEVLWWGKGGTLHGKSPARIAFLRNLVETSFPAGLDLVDYWEDVQLAGNPGADGGPAGGKYYLRYFGKETPTEWLFELPRPGLAEGTDTGGGINFKVDVIDTWDMTITPLAKVFTTAPLAKNAYRLHTPDNDKVPLPGKPYIALRITRVN